MQPVYVATSRIAIDRENSNIFLSEHRRLRVDLENYIETQSKILTSETLALQTIRSGILAGQADFSTDPSASDALATGSLANLKAPPELGAFLGSLERQNACPIVACSTLLLNLPAPASRPDRQCSHQKLYRAKFSIPL